MKVHKDRFTIGITCIGCGVGQSVITACRLSRLPIRTVGLGTNPFAFGAYDCDVLDFTPTIYSPDYVDALIEKCREHRVDLLIPTLDDEGLILAESIEKLKSSGLRVMVADAKFLRLCRDKGRMCTELNRVAPIFVRAFHGAEIRAKIESGEARLPLIVKPLRGFASRGVRIVREPNELGLIDDLDIIQELAVPCQGDPNREMYLREIDKGLNPQVSEISIQLVSNERGELLGRMASYNKLHNGVPIEILPYENDYVWDKIDKLIPTLQSLGMRGPLNIQGRLTDEGLRLFEMNSRFTGITGLRALMGFNEVETCIREWLHLGKGKHPLRLNRDRFGVRQVTDKAISLQRCEKIKDLSVLLNGAPLKSRPTVLVTGACGYLGRNLIRELSRLGTFEVLALSRDKAKAQSLFAGDGSPECFDLEDLQTGSLPLGAVDTVVHSAFARPHCGNQEIADSLRFTRDLMVRATMHHVPAIINISSQSVYGLSRPPRWREDLPPAPETAYGQAKYASELIAEGVAQMNNQTRVTSLRLASLSGGQDGLVPVDLTAKFVLHAIRGEAIRVVGGKQLIERLDVRDAVSGIVAMLQIDPRDWEPVYNLGYGQSWNIVEIAEQTLSLACECGYSSRNEVVVEPKDVKLEAGMDNTKIRHATGWAPRHGLQDTIRSLLDYFALEGVNR